VLLNTQEGIQGGITIVSLSEQALAVKRESGNVVVLSFSVSYFTHPALIRELKLMS
jgi:hypothetical protein